MRKQSSRAGAGSTVRKARNASGILFLAANPLDAPTLQLNEECRAIERMIAIAKYRDQIRFRSCWAVRFDDLVQALNDDTPTVVHFSGHGLGTPGLCLQAEDGRASVLSTEELVELVRAAGGGVTAVVLNACYTEMQAQALASYVACVVGTSQVIEDEAAVAYSRSLYRALASGRSMENAHQQGTLALKRAQAGGPFRDAVAARATAAGIPRLFTRPDVDAKRVHIAGPFVPRAHARRGEHAGRQIAL